jgi:signal transduction histidine kinase
VWFDSQLAPIRRGDEIVGAILVSQDVTKRKRIHAELLASRHMALLGTLAAGVAHEINTPIQFVGDSVQFLSDAVSDLLRLLDTLHTLRSAAADGGLLAPLIRTAREAEAEIDLSSLRSSLPPAFARCIEGLQQISKIVRSLKDFAHPTGEAKQPTDLNHIVETALTIAQSEYKLVATLETDFGELPPITCNAAVITVRDTGTGIPDAIRPRIFDPFFTTKEVGKGTGQGLSIAWSMVNEQHGGELTFDTEVGRGSTFRVRLPVRDTPPPSQTAITD